MELKFNNLWYYNPWLTFFKAHQCILWDEPQPHAKILVMPNNISKAKHTNKRHLTYGICCAWVWSSSHFYFILFYTQSKAFFSFCFSLACGLLKLRAFIEPWSYCLDSLGWVDGSFDFPTCIWKECVHSKC
jgi:hypothetical protein